MTELTILPLAMLLMVFVILLPVALFVSMAEIIIVDNIMFLAVEEARINGGMTIDVEDKVLSFIHTLGLNQDKFDFSGSTYSEPRLSFGETGEVAVSYPRTQMIETVISLLSKNPPEYGTHINSKASFHSHWVGDEI